jgi:hypothetical protein
MFSEFDMSSGTANLPPHVINDFWLHVATPGHIISNESVPVAQVRVYLPNKSQEFSEQNCYGCS